VPEGGPPGDLADGFTVGETATDTNCTGTVIAPASLASLRKLWTMFALIPCAVSTLASAVPGAARSARICALSTAPWRRRLRLVSVSIVSGVL